MIPGWEEQGAGGVWPGLKHGRFGVGVGLRTGTAGTHCCPTDGAGLMALIASQGSSRKKRALRAATIFECLLCARRCSKQSVSSWYLILSTNYKVGAISGLTLQVTDARLGCQSLAWLCFCK